MNLRAASANLLWCGLNTQGYFRFKHALGRVRATQELALERYLRRNAATAIGRELGFASIRTVQEYQERVPVSSYEDYVEHIGRLAAGEQNVVTRDPVKLLQPTAGSAGGAKWVPYTETLQRELRRAVAPWVFDTFKSRPDLLGGPAYWSISPALPESNRKRSRIPVGFEDDSAYLGRAFKPLVDATLAVPANVRHVEDVDLFRRVTLVWLLHARGLRLISIWHPSFLVLLLAPLERDWEELVRDVDTGFSLRQPQIDIPPNPARARELASLGGPDFRRIWPRLRLISCWGDGPAAGHCAELEELFPGVELQHKGLLATEAVVSIPFAGRKPLALTSHFFEFLDPEGRPQPAWALKESVVYSPLVTTGGGLYRYRLMDRVEVTGFLRETPCLRFLGKEDQVSDLFGEKLSQSFVGAAIERVLAKLSIKPRFAMLAPETTDGCTGYRLFIDTPEPIPAGLARVLESALRQNPHYDYCVRLGQLAPAQVSRTGDGAYERYVTRLRENGQRLGDIKPSPLSGQPGWSEVLMEGDLKKREESP